MFQIFEIINCASYEHHTSKVIIYDIILMFKRKYNVKNQTYFFKCLVL